MIRALTLALLVVLLAASGAAAQLAVTSVSASSLKVTAGARASVTLQGTDLDQIQTATVLKGTAPAAGVTAELVPAVSKTSRVVTVVAQTTAAPGRDYKLQLSGGKQTIVPALTIEIAAVVTATAPGPTLPEVKLAAPQLATPQLPPPPTAPAPPKPAAAIVQIPAPTLAPPDPKPASPIAQAPAPTLTLDPKATTAIVKAPAPVPAPATPETKAIVTPSAPTAVSKSLQVPTAILLPAPPRVSSVVPAALQLDPGARVTIAVYGQSLERVQAVAVAPARPGVSGVTAELGAAAPTMRTVTLVAGPAALAGRYQLTALAGTTSFILNTTVDVTARPATPPVLLRVEPTSDGYALVGRSFGSDPTRVIAYEGNARVSSFAMTVTPERITVRSRPSGLIQHRVEVAGASSGVISASYPGPTIGSVGVTSGELAKILASPKAAGMTSPTMFATPLATPGAAGRAIGASTPSSGGGTGGSIPSGPSGPAGGVSRGPTPAPRAQGFAPKSAGTPEITMTGLGPLPVFGQ